MNKLPLEQALTRQHPETDKKTIRLWIHSGLIRVQGHVIRDTKHLVSPLEELTVGKKGKFVSRGGDKLEGALRDFSISAQDKIWIDAGTSTGGFTDCLLQRGAKKVYAVDVGYGQFSWKLRQDARVSLYERTRIQDIKKEELLPPPDNAVMDLSFTPSLFPLLALFKLLPSDREIIVLIKPQFESKGEQGPVISEGIIREEILEKTRKKFHKNKIQILAEADSKQKGRDGNLERFFRIKITQ